MKTLADPTMRPLLDELYAGLQAALGPKLRGVYLYGSLVVGDFDPDISDLDLLAVLDAELTPTEFAALDAAHHAFVAAHPTWDDRIEIAYLTAHALRAFRRQRSPLAIISPGEPFHLIDAGDDWLMNWYLVRTVGQTLLGPPPTDWIDPIADTDYLAAVRAHALAWPTYLHPGQQRKEQSYAILTLCRAAYTLTHGVQPSKRQAAAWAAQQWPTWVGLIEDALIWRSRFRDADVDHAATYPLTAAFVARMVAIIAELPGDAAAR